MASAAFVSAGTNTGNHYYWVTNNDDNSSTPYYVKIIAAQNTSLCDDSDAGMKPTQAGTIDAHTLGPVSHRMLNDKMPPSGIVREFACGTDITIQGGQYLSTFAFVMIYNPALQT